MCQLTSLIPYNSHIQHRLPVLKIKNIIQRSFRQYDTKSKDLNTIKLCCITQELNQNDKGILRFYILDIGLQKISIVACQNVPLTIQ